MYTGLFEMLDEDEAAAVIGHEIGHVAARHGIKRMQAVFGYQLLSLAGLIAMRDRVDPAAAQELSDTVFTLILLGYSRRDELEADRLGTRYAVKAGFAPGGMLGVLEKFEELQRGAPEIAFFNTHPPVRERMKEVRIVISALESSEVSE
jgi:beta-barrel assembly-enhancing protease